MNGTEFDRRLFAWVLWFFVGLCLLVILSSCSPIRQATDAPSSGSAARTYYVITLTNRKQVRCDYITITDAGLFCQNWGIYRWFDRPNIANIELVQ
jgi:hypothetical protein